MAESAYWNRYWRRRISRRTLLGAGAVTALGAASAAFVGCNGDGGGNPPDGSDRDCSRVPAGTPQPCGSITQGRLIEAEGIDPHIDLTGWDIDMLVYTYLYSWSPSEEKIILNNFVTGEESMLPVREAIDRVIVGQDLSEGEAEDVMGMIMDGEATPSQISALLTGLRLKGETVAEITGFARVMRDKVRRIKRPKGMIVDTCGTGGD